MQRSCVGCRRTGDKATLLRLVAVDGSLTADPTARLPGCGAYVHTEAGCWEAALRRRAFARALRREVALPTRRPF